MKHYTTLSGILKLSTGRSTSRVSGSAAPSRVRMRSLCHRRTVRVYAGDEVWCSLDPGAAKARRGFPTSLPSGVEQRAA